MRHLAALVIAATVLGGQGAQATLCPGDQGGLYAAQHSSISFVGTAGGVQPRTDPKYLAWAFEVLASVKGDAGDPAYVELPNTEDGPCSWWFTTGCTYLLGGEPGPNGGVRILPGRSGGSSLITC